MTDELENITLEPIIKEINGITVVILSGIDIPDADIPQPTSMSLHPSWRWVINESGDTYWDSPVPQPTDGMVYTWNEASLTWIEVKSN